MAENAKVDSKTSYTTRLSKNLSASVDMAEDIEVGKGNDGYDEIIKQSPSKKPDVPTGYLTSLRSEKMSFP